MWRYVIWAGPHRPLFGRRESRIPAPYRVSVPVSCAGYVSIMLLLWYISDAVHMWCWRQRQSCWWCCRLMCNLISPLLGPSAHQMHLPFYFFSLLSIASWAELTGYAGLLCWFTWRPWFVIPLSCCTTVKLRHCSLVHLIEMHGSLHVIEIVSF